MVRVLVVDDSAFIRNAISSMLQSDPQIKVIGMAKDGFEAIAKVKTLKPDIVTMDVEMPRMDGVEALKHIMATTPVPIVMVSSLTMAGAKVTLEALEHGALDFIPKNLADLSVNIVKIRVILIEKIKNLARTTVQKIIPVDDVSPAALARTLKPAMAMPGRTTGARRMGVLAIGTSTGGPKALQSLLCRFPKNFPLPILVAQHMPPNFTGPFAERLDQLAALKVKEAKDGDLLKQGEVLVAPGYGHMRVKRVTGIDVKVQISKDRAEFIYRPSVDALMTSVNEVYPGRSLCVILTGMGNDGLKGAISVKKSGGRVFVQDEASCVVYGMPKAIVDEELADKVLSLDELPGEILNAV